MGKWSGFGKMVILLLTSCVIAAGCASSKGAKQKSVEAGQTMVEKQISRLSASEDPDSVKIRITGNQTLTYTSVKQPAPTGVVLYFPETGVAAGNEGSDLLQDSGLIERINLAELKRTGITARLEILLKKDVPYEVQRDGDDLVIVFPNVSTQAEMTPVKEATEIQQTTSEADATRLISVSTSKLENSVDIEIVADGVVKDYKSFTISNPARIVFDLFDIASPSDKEQTIEVNTPWVRQVRHYGYPDRVRVVLDTEESYLEAYTANQNSEGLSIRVGAKTSDGSQSATAAANPSSPPPSAGKAAEGAAWVNRIDFSSEDRGPSTIIIGTTRPVTFEINRLNEKRLQLTLHDTKLPDYRARPIITERFQSAVDRILPLQPAGRPDTTQFVVDLRESVPFRPEQTGNLLEIHFDPSSIPPKRIDPTELPEYLKVVEEGLAIEMQPMAVATSSDEPTVVSSVSAPGIETETAAVVGETIQELAVPQTQEPETSFMAPKQYTGEKIALDFFETDIKNVFRILREISGKNFAVDKDVSGQVTLSLDQPVPWDQVLDLILKMNQLGMTMEGDIIRIATHQTLNSERELAAQDLAAMQESMDREKALEPLITEYIPVNYANAATDVQPQIVTTPERGSVTVDTRNNQIIITDTETMVAKARETIRRIDKVTPQVMIEARIVEATSTFTRNFGVQWTMNAGPIFTKEFAGGLLPEGALDISMTSSNAVAGNGTLGISFTKLSGTPFELVNAQLSASESQGLIKIVSAPRILTLDNKEAFIKQGLAYPLTKLDADGNTVVEFQDVALELTVTPHVTPDNRISLTMAIKNNEVGAVINNEISFTTKETTTELLVNDGDTVVIGGIRKTTKNDNESGLPVLKDIPVLGWMFKEEAITDNLEELLIFITPKIVLLEQRTSG